MTQTCPVCARTFQGAKGLGGHLATYNDAPHATHRARAGIRVPRGPDGKPTDPKTSWRHPPKAVPGPPPAPMPRKSPARVEAASTKPPSARAPSTQAEYGWLDLVQDYTKAVQDARANASPAPQRMNAPLLAQATPPAPNTQSPSADASLPVQAARIPPATELSTPDDAAMANKPAPDAKAPEPSPSTEAATWTAVAAGVGGLVALVLAKKGANAASPPVEEPFRPANVIPSEIWAQQQAVPETTGNAWLDQNLGYPGTIKPRRRWFA